MILQDNGFLCPLFAGDIPLCMGKRCMGIDRNSGWYVDGSYPLLFGTAQLDTDE